MGLLGMVVVVCAVVLGLVFLGVYLLDRSVRPYDGYRTPRPEPITVVQVKKEAVLERQHT